MRPQFDQAVTTFRTEASKSLPSMETLQTSLTTMGTTFYQMSNEQRNEVRGTAQQVLAQALDIDVSLKPRIRAERQQQGGEPSVQMG